MSNTNTPFGFRHLGFSEGGPTSNFSLKRYTIDKDYATAMYAGDLLRKSTDGTVIQYVAGVPNSHVAGVLVYVEYLSTATGQKIRSGYWPASDHAYDGHAFVVPVEGISGQEFVAQAYAAAFEQADIGKNVEVHVGTGTVAGGSAASGMTLDSSTCANTSTLPFQVVRLYSEIASSGENGTDDTANYNCVVVRSNPSPVAGL